MHAIWSMMARLSAALALISVGCLLALSALTGIDVIGRYAFGRPIPGFTNAASLATALVVAGFFPVLTMRKANITLRPFAKIGRGTVARVLDSFAGLMTTAFFGVMAWQYANYAAEAVRSGEYVAVLRWPVGPWWWGVTVMIAVTAVASLVVFVQEARGQAGPGEG
jgi:TRAP-type C4-dicarboxylate transport system permease small subunit